VPYGGGGQSTKVQVQYQRRCSNTMTHFRCRRRRQVSRWCQRRRSGRDSHQDNKVNSSATRSPRLHCAIFLTGAGVTTPAAAMLRDRRTAAAPVAGSATKVTIGGIDAAVKYAGAAPGWCWIDAVTSKWPPVSRWLGCRD